MRAEATLRQCLFLRLEFTRRNHQDHRGDALVLQEGGKRPVEDRLAAEIQELLGTVGADPGTGSGARQHDTGIASRREGHKDDNLQIIAPRFDSAHRPAPFCCAPGTRRGDSDPPEAGPRRTAEPAAARSPCSNPPPLPTTATAITKQAGHPNG